MVSLICTLLQQPLVGQIPAQNPDTPCIYFSVLETPKVGHIQGQHEDEGGRRAVEAGLYFHVPT